MPKPTCVQCSANDSLLWRSAENGQICNECHLANAATKEGSPPFTFKTEVEVKREDDQETKNEKAEGETTPAKATGKGTRKSTRATRYKPKTPASVAPKTAAPRGRGRRSIFKRQPLKAPTATATVVTSDSVFYKTIGTGQWTDLMNIVITTDASTVTKHLVEYLTMGLNVDDVNGVKKAIKEGNYMQVGDIVSMIDIDGGTYYAQIRGFMTDQYCEKSAVVTWLLPTKASPPPESGFNPATYIIGPEEDLARKLDVMEFVMHAPSDYYKASNSPYPLTDNEVSNYSGYIWTSLEPKERT